jgi:D-alanine-D-alanine ligase
LTFADKYLSNESSSKCSKSSKGTMTFSNRSPENLPVDVVLKMRNIAEKLFLRLGLFGVVRIDFLFDEKNSKLYVCEVNAIPGSLAYYFFKKNHIVTNDLIEKLIKISSKKLNKKKINQEFVVDLFSKK